MRKEDNEGKQENNDYLDLGDQNIIAFSAI